MSLSAAITEHNDRLRAEQDALYSVFTNDDGEALTAALESIDRIGESLKGQNLSMSKQPKYIVNDGDNSFLLLSADGKVDRLSPGFTEDEDSLQIEEDETICTTMINKGDGVGLVRYIPASDDYDFPLIGDSDDAWDIDELFLAASDEVFEPRIESLSSEILHEIEVNGDDDGLIRQHLVDALNSEVAQVMIHAYYGSDIKEETGGVKAAYVEILQQVLPSITELALHKVRDSLADVDHDADDEADEDDDGRMLDVVEFVVLSEDEMKERSALWMATLLGDAEAALKLARDTVDRWADVNEPAQLHGVEDVTPLAMASAQKAPEFLKLLIDQGADIDAMDSIGHAPLTYALQGENLDNFRLLLEKGANPDPLEDGAGQYSPLAMAADHGLVEAVKTLLGRGANVNRVGEHGGDALKAAAANGNLECVELLIDAGGNPASVDAEGFSPIHNAVDYGHHDVVAKLLDAGVDVDLRVGPPSEDEGRTPLHRACSHGDLELMQMLVHRGATVDTVDADESTPVMSALIGGIQESEGRAELIQFLVDHGARPDLMMLFMALKESPVPDFEVLFNYMLPKMDSPLAVQSTELDREGIAQVFSQVLSNEPDLKRCKKIKKVLKKAGFVIPSTGNN